MAAQTQASIQTLVYELGGYADPAVTATTINSLYQSAVQRLRLAIHRINPKRMIEADTVTVTSGTDSYALPTNTHDVADVRVADSGSATGYTSLNRIEHSARHQYQGGFCSEAKSSLYSIAGGKIHFWPAVQWSGTVYVDVVKGVASINLAASYDMGVDGWDDWALYDILERLSVSQDEPEKTPGWRTFKSDAWSLISGSCSRDKARPRTVLPVGSDSRDTASDAWRY